jgi:hypothetical protein
MEERNRLHVCTIIHYIHKKISTLCSNLINVYMHEIMYHQILLHSEGELFYLRHFNFFLIL